ncbi:MAG: hypothetical protein IAG13_35185, partial [Deltaproteobacteria bacterium]|nr:hypothetical protein [Nannocystaceae bacterium]
MRDDDLGLTWCVRDAGGDEVASSRLMNDLARLCRDCASRQFPEDEGFVLVHTRLSGALEGTTTAITRGGFRALVSVQRFTRRAGESNSEIRVVASAHRESPGALALRSDRRLARAGMVACSAGGAALLLGTLQLAQALSTWGLLMLLIPLFMAWRMAMTIRLAAELHRDARAAALPHAPDLHGLTADELPRWRALLEVVAAQRDAVTERFQGQGFCGGRSDAGRRRARPGRADCRAGYASAGCRQGGERAARRSPAH